MNKPTKEEMIAFCDWAIENISKNDKDYFLCRLYEKHFKTKIIPECFFRKMYEVRTDHLEESIEDSYGDGLWSIPLFNNNIDRLIFLNNYKKQLENEHS